MTDTETNRIMLLSGDGVGPEVIDEARKTIEAIGEVTGIPFAFESAKIGGAAIDAYGVPIRDEDIEATRGCGGALLGAVGGPTWDKQPRELRPESGLLKLRYSLGLFANLRPVKVFDALADTTPVKPDVVRGVDLLIVRELTGGLYFGKPSEQWTTDEGRQAVDTMAYSEGEIRRIAELGYRLASGRRNKVTSVDKSNVLATSQLWRAVVDEVAAGYPDVATEHQLVDSCAMRLIANPASFDVLIMENTFGDILSDEASVLAGSLGMLPSASIGADGTFGVYEPIHGSAPDIAGKGIANPTGAILSAAMMLRVSFGLDAQADAIETAVAQTLDAGARTADIAQGGVALSTEEFGDEIRRRLAAVVAA